MLASVVALLEPLVLVSFALVLAILALVFTVRGYHDRVARLKDEVRALQSSRQSLATTYGRITEQWAPFMQSYPHDPKRFRFLGSPVDGVQFTDDGILFVEFKTNTSRLTDGERRIRDLVEQGRVSWLEVRIDEAGVPVPPPAAPPEDDARDWAPPEARPDEAAAPRLDDEAWRR